MRIAMVCVGDELLDGRVTDANTREVARALGERGLELSRAVILPDDLDALSQTLDLLAREHEVVMVSGGLGPTQDDRTREAAAALIGQPLEVDERSRELLLARFAERGVAVTQNNARQWLFPRTAEVMANGAGTAAGFAIQHAGATLYFLPGVPRELAWYLRGPLIDRIAPEAQAREQIALFGLPESHVEDALTGIEALAAQLSGRVAYCASYPVIEVTIKAPDAERVAQLSAFVRARVGAWEIGSGGELLAARVGRLLEDRDATVTTAESCTGGLLAGALTEVPGSGGWFETGFVTYAKSAKVALVGVQTQALESFGAVSAQVVCQMAQGARQRASATYGLAISGIAGPDPTEGKPVGTVHFALATPGGVWHERALFRGRDRAGVRVASVYTALRMLLWELEGRLIPSVDRSGAHDLALVWELDALTRALDPDARAG